ncbi:hypothetical protein [Herbidospora cretacea]|uniref:hypothetical protein n=1 Tax=Herbidospora cretacea TaxID=28444 RepID=UPI0007743AC7|nr:hypothetical protein [Herbidospora cretacea]
MGVDVTIMRVTRPGSSPRRRRLDPVDAFLDVRDVFADVCRESRLPMVRRADPYGSLILTSAEMPQFVAELTQTLARTEDASVRSVVTEILRLGELCAADADLELHLEGD